MSEDWREQHPLAITPAAPAYLRGALGQRMALIHAGSRERREIAQGVHDFYRRLVPHLRDLGFEIGFQTMQPRINYGPPGRHIHISTYGRWPGMERSPALHANWGYLPGYWYFDPRGYRWNSSIAQMRFDPTEIDGEVAQTLFGQLRRRFVKHGSSFHRQPESTELDVPEDYILVLLQGQNNPLRVGAFLDEVGMLRAVLAGRDGRPVLVKHHPRARNPATERFLADAAIRADGVQVVEGNLHDLLERASAVTCLNSGTGFEAFLHRRPVIVFGQTDYHHCAETVRDPHDFPEALARALDRRRPYPKFVWWFLSQTCIAVDAPDFEERITKQLIPHL